MKDSRGFSLVELLIAVTLTAGAMLGVATMTLTAYGRVNRSGELTSATHFAQQRIEWIRSQPYTALSVGTTAEQLHVAETSYLRTTSVVADVPEPGLKQITVIVDTPSGRSVRLATLLSE